jgi:hypothetical protein
MDCKVNLCDITASNIIILNIESVYKTHLPSAQTLLALRRTSLLIEHASIQWVSMIYL